MYLHKIFCTCTAKGIPTLNLSHLSKYFGAKFSGYHILGSPCGIFLQTTVQHNYNYPKYSGFDTKSQSYWGDLIESRILLRIFNKTDFFTTNNAPNDERQKKKKYIHRIRLYNSDYFRFKKIQVPISSKNLSWANVNSSGSSINWINILNFDFQFNRDHRKRLQYEIR